MQEQHLHYLLERVNNGTASAQDIDELARFIREDQDPALFSAVVSAQLEHYTASASDMNLFLENASIVDKILAMQEVVSNGKQPETPVHFLRKWGWAAASIILLLGIGGYLWTTTNTPPLNARITPADIAPGKNGAVLTLANGQQIVLDSLGNGVVAMQNGTKVLLREDGLAYYPGGGATPEIMYNTITTPKGRQFQVTLPDGTKAWLNAASSITYPTLFAGTERAVKVTGEVYLEVAQNTQLPFRVNVNDKATVEVLGTHFNVNAYENEDTINTTLLAGSVKVAQPGNGVVLKPGQQAQLQAQPGIRIITNPDIEKVMAWKNGLFKFDGLTFEAVMRQLERWYDIEVVYENNKAPNNTRLAGKMTRGVSLNGLLKYLGKMGVHYRLEGRTLTILP